MQREVQKADFVHPLFHRDNPTLRCQALMMESHTGHTFCTHKVLLQTPQTCSKQGKALLSSSIRSCSHTCAPQMTLQPPHLLCTNRSW